MLISAACVNSSAGHRWIYLWFTVLKQFGAAPLLSTSLPLDADPYVEHYWFFFLSQPQKYIFFSIEVARIRTDSPTLILRSHRLKNVSYFKCDVKDKQDLFKKWWLLWFIMDYMLNTLCKDEFCYNSKVSNCRTGVTQPTSKPASK